VPTRAAFWCSTKTAKISPKIIPASTIPMPAKVKSRRALNGANRGASSSAEVINGSGVAIWVILSEVKP